jgi:DNA-binding NarL/FixJ family response regulator
MMSWTDLTQTIRETAERELTPKQLAVFQDRLNGHSWRTIANAHHINEATARGRHERALKRIAQALRKDAA